ncbi:MAG: L,D-transpeptidase family protein [Acidimicrobiales bacterium]
MNTRSGRRAGLIVAAIVVTVLTGSCAQQTDPVAGIGPTSSTNPLIEIIDPEGEPSSPTAGGDGSAVPSSRPHTVVAEATVSEIVVRSAPDLSAEPVTTLVHPTPTGSPLVFRAVDGGAVGQEWIDVYLPIEPNGSRGWVRRDEVVLSSNPYRIEIDRATYSLRAYNLDELIVEATIAVGTGATPTPVGDFYLLELLAPPDPTGPYGPFAFGLSGFSEVLEEFGGADQAIIGLHGTNDPTSLGTDVSHGCIRLENDVIEQLAQTLPLGTPVLIT